MAEKAAPKVTNINMGSLNAAQDDALRTLARKLSRERGNDVKRAQITREALAMLCRAHGVVWPC